MELHQLRYFVAVADLGGFTRAAEHCGVAQPSLSQQVKKLEEEFGEPLFVRGRKGVTLTAVGRTAYQHAAGILESTAQLRDAIAGREDFRRATVTMGIIPTMAPYLLPEALPMFRSGVPQVSVVVREGKTVDMVEMVKAGDLEFAIASDIGRADRKGAVLRVSEFARERLMLALPERHGLATRPDLIQVSELGGQELILLGPGNCLTDQTIQLCGNIQNSGQLECQQLQTLQALVAAGLGIGVVPEMLVRSHPMPGIVYRRLGAPEPTRSITILQRRDRTLSGPAQALLDCIVNTRP